MSASQLAGSVHIQTLLPLVVKEHKGQANGNFGSGHGKNE